MYKNTMFKLNDYTQLYFREYLNEGIEIFPRLKWISAFCGCEL